jgi:hypothetical protein
MGERCDRRCTVQRKSDCSIASVSKPRRTWSTVEARFQIGYTPFGMQSAKLLDSDGVVLSEVMKLISPKHETWRISFRLAIYNC